MHQEAEGKIEVWFGDESSFHLNPNSMYGWQQKGVSPLEKVFLPTKRSKAVNKVI